MYAAVTSASVLGVDAALVRVEVFIASGLPSFTLVGLPGAAVQESRERVRAALKQLGFPLPPSRIVVNLAPADVRKEGPAFDLPIALALLAADRRLPKRLLDHVLAFGELALDGSLRPVRGAVSIGVLAVRAGGLSVLAPPDNGAEVALVPGAKVVAPASLAAALAHLTGRAPLPGCQPARSASDEPVAELTDVRGHGVAKRALEVAAAGRHNLLLTGPPGAGKSMLAARLPGILPPLTASEAVEVSRVHSSAGLLSGRSLITRPPFRSPHHSGSQAGIVGGGALPRPGEASLAHHGVLFLDELPEFSRAVLEALRQPLEDGVISISRAYGSLSFPARFQLVAARNPCPCGHHDVDGVECACSAAAVARYQQRVSGPLLDRIDLRLRIARLSDEELLGASRGERTQVVAGRVLAARERMLSRQGKVNGELSGDELQRHARPTGAAETLLREVVSRLRLTGRGFDRLLRVARTLADLADETRIGDSHLAEAASYRQA